MPGYEPSGIDPGLVEHYAEEMGRGAPAVAIARSKRAIGQACPTLLGKPKADIDKNATRDVTAMLAKSGMAMRVVYTTVEGDAIELPIVLPSSWLKVLIEDYPYLLSGYPSNSLGNDLHDQLEAFWTCYAFYQPGHEAFKKSKQELRRTLPLAVHGDEGRYLKKGNFMVCTIETLIGNDAEKKTTKAPCRCHSDPVLSRYADVAHGHQGDSSFDHFVELASGQHVNDSGNEFLSKFLLFGMSSLVYKKDKGLLTKAFEMVSEDLSMLHNRGLQALLNYKNARSFAWCNVKGSDNTLITSWLLFFIKLSSQNDSRHARLEQEVGKLLADNSVRVSVVGVDVPDEAKESTIKAAASSEAKEQVEEKEMVVDPWSVKGKIDYEKLIRDFGSTKISKELLERMRKLTVGSGRVSDLHCWLRRNIFFSHRELDAICGLQEKGKPFYLYTGRGPSSAAMHLGHLLPFMFTQFLVGALRWLQKAFNVPLVIQMTDDEKFLWKGEYDPEKGDNLHVYQRYTIENAKDIIACGFDKSKTFIFSDCDYVGHMYPNIVRVWKAITYNTAKGAFGFQGESNIGQSAFPAIQAVPSFPSSFSVPFKGDQHLPCLIPCAIDQDPYFRVTRDIAHKLVPKDHPLKGKPSLIHCKFFPPLTGAEGKMAASDENSAIFLTDTPEDIEKKINNYAFSDVGSRLDQLVSFGWGCGSTSMSRGAYVFRMILEYKEAKYVDKQYANGEEWFKDRKPAILALNPLANLPYLVDGDTCVCQTNAIMSYLGDKFDMNGTTEAQKIRTQELLCEIYDVRNSMIDLVYPFKNVTRTKEEFDTNAKAKVGKPPFAKFENLLAFKDNLSGGKWFVLQDGPGVADFHIWEMLDQHKMLSERIGGPDIFAEFPKCKAFYDAFKALPTLKNYFASEEQQDCEYLLCLSCRYMLSQFAIVASPTPRGPATYSCGRQTAKEQREKGADLDADVSYQWLRFFLDDDVELKKIEEQYGSGQGEDYWSTGQVKKKLIEVLKDLVKRHQEIRAKITDEEVQEWMKHSEQLHRFVQCHMCHVWWGALWCVQLFAMLMGCSWLLTTLQYWTAATSTQSQEHNVLLMLRSGHGGWQGKPQGLARLCTKGMIGCFLSHRRIWQKMVSEKLPAVVVLEDDVRLVEDFSDKLLKLMDELPADWEVCLLGAIGNINPDVEPFHMKLYSFCVGGGRPSPGKTRRVSDNVFVPHRPAGTHAYLVSLKGAERLVKELPLACYHVDLTAWSLPNLKLYAAVNQIATQDFEAASTASGYFDGVLEVSFGASLCFLQPGRIGTRKAGDTLGTVYIVTSSTLISFNKYLMQPGRFSHAVHLTAFHMVVTLVLSLAFYKVAPQFYPSMAMAKANICQVAKWIAPLGFLFALALYCSNQAYKYSSVAFLQFCKQGNVALMFFMSCAVGSQSFSWQKLAVLTVVIAGCTTCAHGEIHFVMIGLVLQLASQLTECSKNLIGEAVMGSAGLKLDVLTFVLFQAPFSLLFLSVGVCFSWTPEVVTDFRKQPNLEWAWKAAMFAIPVPFTGKRAGCLSGRNLKAKRLRHQS
ncbi:unnamed protein product [Cladocopium goreaui]|uniref:tryptophan--tRNA ligase n=1 Tax=Cladocopium goreaui TaxID=2562237 RepID=A0A9P1D0J6_9DINO|nr:unnamed protein product [Cladocopium goreaui]